MNSSRQGAVAAVLIAACGAAGAIASLMIITPTILILGVDVRPMLIGWFVVTSVLAGAVAWTRFRGFRSDADGAITILRSLAVPCTAILLEAGLTQLRSQGALSLGRAIAVGSGFVIFVAVWIMPGPSLRSVWHGRFQLGKRLMLNPATAILAVFIGFYNVFPSLDTASDTGQGRLLGENFERWFVTQPRVGAPLPSSEADLTVVEFIDFQCPACKEANRYYEENLFKNVRTRYPGRVQIIRRDLPLDSECNPHATSPHAWACEAAVAMRLASEKGKAKEFEAWLWKHQARLTPSEIYSGVRDIAGVADMGARYGEVITKVKEDIELATLLGVTGTPTYFLNGIKIGFMPAQNWERALRIELGGSD